VVVAHMPTRLDLLRLQPLVLPSSAYDERIRRRCASLVMSTWSKHSRRTVPISRMMAQKSLRVEVLRDKSASHLYRWEIYRGDDGVCVERSLYRYPNEQVAREAGMQLMARMIAPNSRQAVLRSRLLGLGKSGGDDMARAYTRLMAFTLR
jgi:hypothetical protein